MTDLSEHEKEYRLIFEGPADPTPDTMRKIKGVFLAELEMPVEEIMAILQNAPAMVRSASTPNELDQPLKLLRDAGSKVMIVGKDGHPWNPETVDGLDGAILFEIEDSTADKSEDDTSSSGAYSLKEESPSDLSLLLEEAASGIEDAVDEEDPSENETTNAYVLPIDKELSQSLAEKDAELAALAKEERDSEVAETTPATPATEEFNLTLALEDDSPHTTQPAAQKAAEVSDEPPAPAPEPDKLDLTLALEDDAPHVAQPAAPSPPVEEPAITNSFESKLELSLAGDKPQMEQKVEQAETPPAVEEPKSPGPLAATTEATPQEAPPVAAKPVVAAPKSAAPKIPTPPPAGDSVPPDINVVPVRDRRKKNLPPGVDIGVAIAFGSILLGVANWMYFNAPPPVDNADMVQAQEMALKVAQKKKELQKRQREETERLEKEAAALAKPYIYKFATEIDTTHVELTLHMANGEAKTATLTLQGTEPPELTNDQIARGESKPAWIRRTETAPFEFVQSEDGTFSAQATSKVFVEADGEPVRLVRKTTISGKMPEKEQTRITVEVLVVQQDGTTPNDDTWILTHGEKTDFLMKKTFDLELQAEDAEVKKEEERTVK